MDESDPVAQPFRVRINRSITLFENLRDAWNAYLDRRPHRLEMQIDADGTGRLVVRREVPIPPELSLILGEFLYQLRAALDNCLYAVAVIDSGQDPPPNADRLQWPICTKRSEWSNQRRRLTHLSDELLEMLEAIQPYNAELPDWNCLRILNDLARIDRHRTLHLAALYPATAKVWHDQATVRDLELHPGVIHDGWALATFQYAGEGPVDRDDIDGDFEFDLELADVEESTGPGGQVGRPYGSLERRLRAVFDVTQDYMLELLWIAQNPDPQRAGSTPTDIG